MPEQKSALNIVMGAASFGEAGQEAARIHDLRDVGAVLDVFQSHGHTEIDTARIYGGGTSEEYLGKIDWKERGLKLETKLYPIAPSAQAFNLGFSISHSPEDLRKFLDISLQALKADQIEVWYLHAPDRTTPYEVTMKGVNDLYKEGKFKRFGLSNHASWEVAEIVGICKANGYVLPTVYQGIYNAIHRNIEPELIPCLRKFGISFYAYSPLGGGFFTGRYHSQNEQVEKGTRFDPERGLGKSYRSRYWNDHYFKAVDVVQKAVDKAGLTFAEVALRWISHHSQLRREHGDAVIIGASSVKHIKQNLVDLEKGPLPDVVIKALDEAWEVVKPYAAQYWH